MTFPHAPPRAGPLPSLPAPPASPGAPHLPLAGQTETCLSAVTGFLCVDRGPRVTGGINWGEAGPSQKEGSALRQAIRAQRAQTARGEPPAPEGAEREASMGTEGHVQGRRSPRCLRQGRRLPEAGVKLGRCHGFRKQGELCPPPSDPLLRPALAGEGSLPPRPHAAAAGDGQGFH